MMSTWGQKGVDKQKGTKRTIVEANFGLHFMLHTSKKCEQFSYRAITGQRNLKVAATL